jgi:ribonuclease HI
MTLMPKRLPLATAEEVLATLIACRSFRRTAAAYPELGADGIARLLAGLLPGGGKASSRDDRKVTPAVHRSVSTANTIGAGTGLDPDVVVYPPAGAAAVEEKSPPPAIDAGTAEGDYPGYAAVVSGALPDRVLLYSDGASRGNPGPGGAGFVLCAEDGAVLYEGTRFLGRCTNNEAEYEALIAGLETARRLGIAAVEVRADSQLIIRQLTGQYQVKHPRLKSLYARARRAAAGFSRVVYRHVPRAENRRADELANRAIDEAE